MSATAPELGYLPHSPVTEGVDPLRCMPVPDDPPVPLQFGIRRMADAVFAKRVSDRLATLRAAGELPEELKIERRPEALLLPLDITRRRLDRGFSPRRLVSARSTLEHTFQREQDRSCETNIVDVVMSGGTHLNLVVESRQLADERASIARVLGWYGINEFSRQQRRQEHRLRNPDSLPRQHIELGRFNRPLSIGQRQSLEHITLQAIDEVYDIPEGLRLERRSFYPDTHLLTDARKAA